jgi:hypothetical protein
LTKEKKRFSLETDGHERIQLSLFSETFFLVSEVRSNPSEAKISSFHQSPIMPAFPCGYCHKSFASIGAMKSHIGTHHVDASHVAGAFPAKTEPATAGRAPPDDNWTLSSDHFECFPCR